MQQASKHENSLRASIKDGIANAVKLGTADTYVGPFAIFLKASPIQIGLVSALAPFVGALMQGFGVLLSERFKSRRKFIFICVAFEGIFWLPIAMLPFVMSAAHDRVSVLIALLVFAQVAVGLCTPVWNSLISELVPASFRGRFFGKRSRLGGIATFLSLIIAGQFLHLTEAKDLVAQGYLIIFSVAAIARLTSAYYLSCHEDLPYAVATDHKFSFWDFLRRSHRSNFAKFVFFISLMNMAMMVSGPYFAVHMLKHLKLSYAEFTAVTAALLVAQFITLQRWGTLSDKYGTKRILSFCGIGIATIPFCWLIATKTWHIVLLQVFAGSCWAGFSLASANFLFDAVTPQKRSRCVAYQAIVNGVGVLAGSMLGGYLITNVAFMTALGNAISHGTSPYPSLFLLSGILRTLACLVFFSMFKEVRNVIPIGNKDLIFEIVQLRPISGLTFSVVAEKLTRRNRGSAQVKPDSENPPRPENVA